MSIYIITNDVNQKVNLYKVGRSTQTQTKLIQRYKTALGNPRIVFHHLCDDNVKMERLLHEKLKEYRTDGEWFQINYYKMMRLVIDCLDENENRSVDLDDVDIILNRLTEKELSSLGGSIEIRKDLSLLYRLKAMVKMRITNTESEDNAIDIIDKLISSRKDVTNEDNMSIEEIEKGLDSSITIDRIRSDKELQGKLITRLKGGYYLFRCNANVFFDKNTATSNKELMGSVVPYHITDINLTKAVKHFKSRYKRDTTVSQSFLDKYDICEFRESFTVDKDGSVMFSFLFSLDESEEIIEELFGNVDFCLPTLYRCKECDYNINNKSRFDDHRSSDNCLYNRGIKIRPKVVEYECEECGFQTIDKTKYDNHRKTFKCREARGEEIVRKPRKKKWWRCDLCPKSPPFPTEKRYNRHREGPICIRKQKKALDILKQNYYYSHPQDQLIHHSYQEMIE